MLRISVMNTKGGCGKTTVATNLASYCACQGYATSLFDYDRQASSVRWLKQRQSCRPPVHGIAAFAPAPQGSTRSWHMRVPDNTRYLITDTPASYGLIDIEDRVAESDIILIPVLPSWIDIHSTAEFVRELLVVAKAHAHRTQLAIVTNRNRAHTRAVDKLERFLQEVDIPVIARIRDTQHYVNAAEQGLGIHELAERDTHKDSESWATLLHWLDTAGEDFNHADKILRNCSG